MEAWELTVREQVRELVARYTWAADAGHTDEVADCFTPDGVLDVGAHGGRWTGRERIVAALNEVVDRIALSGEAPTPVRHHVANLSIDDVTESTAQGRSYFSVFTDSGVDHWGRYYDRYQLHDENWRLAERVVRVDGAAPTSRVVAHPV